LEVRVQAEDTPGACQHRLEAGGAVSRAEVIDRDARLATRHERAIDPGESRSAGAGRHQWRERPARPRARAVVGTTSGSSSGSEMLRARAMPRALSRVST